jgi:hypothetical protein
MYYPIAVPRFKPKHGIRLDQLQLTSPHSRRACRPHNLHHLPLAPPFPLSFQDQSPLSPLQHGKHLLTRRIPDSAIYHAHRPHHLPSSRCQCDREHPQHGGPSRQHCDVVGAIQNGLRWHTTGEGTNIVTLVKMGDGKLFISGLTVTLKVADGRTPLDFERWRAKRGRHLAKKQ